MVATSPFLQKLAAPLLDELRAVKYLKDFAANTDVIGAHAEAVVRRLVSRTASPLRVSTGAVIDEALDPKKVPQVDTPSSRSLLFESPRDGCQLKRHKNIPTIRQWESFACVRQKRPATRLCNRSSLKVVALCSSRSKRMVTAFQARKGHAG